MTKITIPAQTTHSAQFSQPTQTTHPALESNAAAVARLVELFVEKSSQLRFPDVDADSLCAARTAVESQRVLVEEAELALGDARDQLAILEAGLLQSAQKAHAYATVFAAGDEPLLERLEDMKLGTQASTGRKKRPIPVKKALPRERKSAGTPDGLGASGELAAE